MSSASSQPTEHMQCMEVWGGNVAMDSGVSMPGLDAWVYSQPFRGDADHGEAGGGDVYYVSSCATGRITRLLVADVSGHGSEAAMSGKVLRKLMRRYVNHIHQGRFIEAVNRMFARLERPGRFATAVAAGYFAPDGTLSVSNAGHPPPFLYRAKTGQWSLITDSDEETPGEGIANAPLGIVPDTRYTRRDVSLKPGDQVLVYSDSAIESHDADGSMLGVNGLLALVQSVSIDQPHAFVGLLRDRLAAVAPGNLEADDVTFMLFGPNRAAIRASPLKRAVGMARFGLKIITRPFGGEPIPWPEFSRANLGGAMIPALGRSKRL